MLAGVNEGLLPFKMDDENNRDADLDSIALRLQEERRLMYVGITRAQRTLAVNWLRRRKKGRDTIAGLPSRFIAEMALSKETTREDPREKIKALRAEFAQRALDATAVQASINASVKAPLSASLSAPINSSANTSANTSLNTLITTLDRATTQATELPAWE